MQYFNWNAPLVYFVSSPDHKQSIVKGELYICVCVYTYAFELCWMKTHINIGLTDHKMIWDVPGLQNLEKIDKSEEEKRLWGLCKARKGSLV